MACLVLGYCFASIGVGVVAHVVNSLQDPCNDPRYIDPSKPTEQTIGKSKKVPLSNKSKSTKTKVSKPQKIDQYPEDKQCAICLDDVAELYLRLECRHIFHVHCIDKWTEQNDTCPTCRRKAKF